MENVTAVLLNYKRPDNIPRIILQLQTFGWITEIIVWDNAVTSDDEIAWERGVGVFHIRSNQNYYTYGRYMASQLARNKVIITQDDDVSDVDYEFLWEEYNKNPGIHYYLDPSHYRYAQRGNYNHNVKVGENLQFYVPPNISRIMQEGLVGYGAIFPRDIVPLAFQRYSLYSDNIDLAHHKADRVFMMMSNCHKEYYEAKVNHMQGAYDREVALYRQADHQEKCKEIVKECEHVFSKHRDFWDDWLP